MSITIQNTLRSELQPTTKKHVVSDRNSVYSDNNTMVGLSVRFHMKFSTITNNPIPRSYIIEEDTQ